MRAAQPVYMETDPHGNPVPKYRTEVRTGWTAQNLYFLFVCPYEQLNLRPNPKTSTETYGLWNWDVAEVFIGADFKDVKRYKEFEISPQGEWTDLDIDLHKPHHEEGWTWNSGFQVSARIDRAARVWYGAVKIPYSAIDTPPPAAGNNLAYKSISQPRTRPKPPGDNMAGSNGQYLPRPGALWTVGTHQEKLTPKLELRSTLIAFRHTP